MFGNIAAATAVLACAAGASQLAAQTSAPAKPPAVAQKPPTASTTPTSTAAAATPIATHHPTWTKEEIVEAQTGLAKAGYYRGNPTGNMNADTHKALKAFQKANDMPATGRLSDSVLSKLKSA
jgi:peptidoglycan hydrolase-like protein with peptidoglycan-binding domain